MKMANMFTQRELELLEFLTRSVSNDYEDDAYGYLNLEAIASIRSKLGFEALATEKVEPKGDDLFKTLDVLLWQRKPTNGALLSFGMSMTAKDWEVAAMRTSIVKDNGYGSFGELDAYEDLTLSLDVEPNGAITVSIGIYNEEGKQYSIPLKEKEIEYLENVVTEKCQELEIGIDNLFSKTSGKTVNKNEQSKSKPQSVER